MTVTLKNYSIEEFSKELEVVANHHTPARASHERFDLLEAVYVAQILAHEIMDTNYDASAELDLEYLAKLGVADQLDSWRTLARKQL